MPRKKISVTVYLEKSQDTRLRALRDRTGIPAAVIIRDAIELSLRRWEVGAGGVLERAEQLVSEKQLELGEQYDLPAEYAELNDVITHAQGLSVQRDEALAKASHYRQALNRAVQALQDALEAAERDDIG